MAFKNLIKIEDLPEKYLDGYKDKNGNFLYESWNCVVDYKITDNATGKVHMDYKSKACYAGIWNDIRRLVVDSGVKPEDIVVVYGCKRTGDVRNRAKFLENVCKMLSRHFAMITLYFEDGELRVSARSRPHTPTEMFFVLGAFLRLSWEQVKGIDWNSTFEEQVYGACTYIGTHYGHIPLAIGMMGFDFNHKYRALNEADKKQVYNIVLRLLRYRKIYSLVLNKLTNKTAMTPYIQLKAYKALLTADIFKERFPELAAEKYNPDNYW